MVDVKTDILISAPLNEVAQYTSDPDHAPEWYSNIKSVEWKTEKPLVEGSKIAFKAYFLGKELSYTYEVITLSEKKMVMQTAEGPFPMETQYIWEAVAPQLTRMILRNSGDPKGFSKFIAPFMAFKMRQANQKDLKCLKRILEKDI